MANTAAGRGAPGLPESALGLNQTIIFAIPVLVVAALIGTNGSEQFVSFGLSDRDFGVGIAGEIGIAAIANIADLTTRAVSRKRQAEFGKETK